MHQWYYKTEANEGGPVSYDELVRLKEAGEIEEATKVWREGLSEWGPYEQLAVEEASIAEDKEGSEGASDLLRAIASWQLYSLVGCLVMLLNPLPAFAFVYSLQARNAERDGRTEDAETKLSKCQQALKMGLVLSLILYIGVAILFSPLLKG